MTARLESWYVPERGGPGTMLLRVVNVGRDPLADVTLSFDSVVQLTPSTDAAALVGRRSGHHELALPTGLVVGAGEVWESGPLTCGHRPAHANDGPVGAYLRHGDGTVEPVRTSPTVRVGGDHAWLAPVPGGRPASTDDPDVLAAWTTAVALERHVFAGPRLLDDPDGVTVTASIDPTLGAETYDIDAAATTIVAGSRVALQWALLTIGRARRARVDVPAGRTSPMRSWRGLHVDLARQFFPATDVEWVIRLAASRRCNRVHLHLTDDESWRLPVAAVPALTDVGAWRGDGLPIPPLLGSGPAPFGGRYTADDIAAWVALADEVGVELVPEIDLPGHCFAALAAVPALLDPADTSTASSVQYFSNNTLNPGVAATWAFLESVFAAVAEAFGGRWLHLGGDEVAAGSWSGSPAATCWAAERRLDGSSTSIERAFMAEVIDLARRVTGGRVGVWQEAAESGALAPGDGYVVGWKSAEDCRALAAAGHDVVVAPAEHYYLDMAAEGDWFEPGTSWAGHASVAGIEAYDPTAGWSAEERSRLMGVQACIWTEHAPDRPTLERLLLPRLDAIADAAWTTTPIP